VVEYAVWVDEIFRVEYSSAVVALISTCWNVMTVGAFTLNKPIWQESLIVLAVWENDVLSENVSILVQSPVEFLDELLVNRALSPSVVVELDAELFDALSEDSMILVG
jgi:hypothetical protein